MIGGYLQVGVCHLKTIPNQKNWRAIELQLRRPNKDRYRLDNLLERKAREGVKIYVIL